ncbi:MAG: uroporphyrinogen-III synthase [Pseudomonadota bacterium]|nr:MAG: uroporphyrinogen-III synthase [Pseudomonadota bacterium]
MNAHSLVLVTRTAPAGIALAARVAEAGFESVHCAPFRLEGPANPAAKANELRVCLPADRVILTSQEAVRRAVELVGVEPFNRSLVIVPGRGTAEVAQQAGLKNVIYPDRHGTSEAMLGMEELREVDGLDVVILAAAGGRGLIGQVVERRGGTVERVHVYRRVPCALPDDLETRIGRACALVTLAASREAVDGLCRSLSPPARGRVLGGTVIAPSERVLAHARGLGFAHCLTAAGASDESMLRALARHA